ncbi:MAG: cell division protein FtsL [Thermicanus sp.]|nr:cell division protein FtsL [Thermicanus sp.]
MSKIYYGNLAVKPQESPAYKTAQKAGTKKRKVVIHYTLPLKEKLAYLLLLAAMVVVAGFILSRYAMIAGENYQIEKMKREIADLEKESEVLRIQVAELSSPERILQIANDMGLTRRDGNVATVKIAGLGKVDLEESTP